jgi:hypothetical protein
MLNITYVPLPVAHVTLKEIELRLAALETSFDRLGEPIGIPKVQKKREKRGPTPKYRKRGFCRVLGPEEWNLVFPEIPSEYGGTVCYRSR